MKTNRPIYILSSELYDSREECYGPCFGDEDDYLEATYHSIYKHDPAKHISKKKMREFEVGKLIIRSKKYVKYYEARQICNEELNNPNNKTEEDFINSVNKRINDLNTINSPEYKEQTLLNKINELYSKVKGILIKEEVLHNGKFLKTIKETYILPNNKIVAKEKIVKNNGKNAVIIIAKTDDRWPNERYIITSQQRMNNKLIAEFPSGYIEDGESPEKAAKRELMEETGYTSDNIEIIDEAYTSPGIDNSKTYIAYAQDCYKTDTYEVGGTELVSFDLITGDELDYLVVNNIM